jgi:EmrB/QacA subfamily drug resistance transporter
VVKALASAGVAGWLRIGLLRAVRDALARAPVSWGPQLAASGTCTDLATSTHDETTPGHVTRHTRALGARLSPRLGPDPSKGAGPAERKWWTLFASCIAIFMLLLDVTIVNVALPSIERSLSADFSDLQWVIDAYALTLAGVLLAAGSLADKVGRKRVFMLGLAIFTASSLACGLAPDPLFLHVSRAAQGIGGAMMFGTSLALIAQEFQGRERGIALGIWGGTTALAVSTGPLVGGALVDALSWRWIFLVNVPIGLAALVVARRRLRESRNPAASGVDIRGVALLCPALFLLVYALIRGNDEGWGSALIIGCFAASALLLVLFVVAERRTADPLLDLSLFRKPAFTGVMTVGFALSASIFSMFLYITLFFQKRAGLLAVRGGTPVAAGHRSHSVRLAA